MNDAEGVDIKEVPNSDLGSWLEDIGKLRFDVWLGEGSLDTARFPSGRWIDQETDTNAQHFIAVDRAARNLVGSSRLILHTSVESADRDVHLWLRTGNPLRFPLCDLGRLVIKKSHRKRGIAHSLNQVRVDAARALGARTIIATASAGNAKLLKKLGFFDIGEQIVFDDRPHTLFYALQLNLDSSVTEISCLDILTSDPLAREVLSYLSAASLVSLCISARSFDTVTAHSGNWRSRLRRIQKWIPLCQVDDDSCSVIDMVHHPCGVDEDDIEKMANHDSTGFSWRRRFMEQCRLHRAVNSGSYLPRTHFVGHSHGVNCLSVHPDIAAALSQNQDRESISYLFGGSPYLVSGSMNSCVLLHDFPREQDIVAPTAAFMGHEGAVTGVCWTSSTEFITASYDGTVQIWNAELSRKFSGSSSAALASWQCHDDRALTLDWDSSRRLAVSGGRDGAIHVLDPRCHTSVARIDSGDVCVYSVAVQSNTVVVGTHSGSVVSFDLRRLSDYSICSVYKMPSNSPVMSVALQGNLIASGCKSGTVSISSLREAGKSLLSFRAHDRGVRSLAFAAPGETLISTSNDGTVKNWGIGAYVRCGQGPFKSETQSFFDVQPFATMDTHGAQVTQVEVHGSAVFTASMDNCIWEHTMCGQ